MDNTNTATAVAASTKVQPLYGKSIPVYVARGITYQIEWYDDNRDFDGTVSLCVYAFRADGTQVWSGCAPAYGDSTMLEMVRDARNMALGRV